MLQAGDAVGVTQAALVVSGRECATGSWTEEVPAIAASKRREEFILIPIERYFTMGLHCSKTSTKKVAGLAPGTELPSASR